MKTIEINCQTGAITERDMTPEEIAQMEAMELEVETEEIVPEKISKLQLKVQLVQMGFDLQLIENAINQLTEPQRTIAMLAWTDATNIHRDNSFITMVAQILQLTEKQVDQIFIEGDKIKL